jgi:hypothetical protein
MLWARLNSWAVATTLSACTEVAKLRARYALIGDLEQNSSFQWVRLIRWGHIKLGVGSGHLLRPFFSNLYNRVQICQHDFKEYWEWGLGSARVESVQNRFLAVARRALVTL